MNESCYRDVERRSWESARLTPIEHRVHLERNDVTVRIQEVGEGPPVLFLHAAVSSGASWIALATRMPGFRCFLLDRPGAGLSDPLEKAPDVDRLPRFADTLAVDVLDALRLDSAHLVSASFGGYIALRTAAAAPERVGRIVQFGYPVGAAVGRVPSAMRVMSLPLLWRIPSAIPVNSRTVRSMFARIGHGESIKAGRITEEVIDEYSALLRHTDTMRNDMAMGRAFYTVRGLRRLTLPDALLAKISAPTLFLWGANDPFGGTEAARLIVDRIPNAKLEILPGAGHGPWLDDLDYAVSATSDFLGK